MLIYFRSQIFFSQYDLKELPAHIYLQSVHNISIEWSWRHLCVDFGDNTVLEYWKGEHSGIFRFDIPLHVYVFFV